MRVCGHWTTISYLLPSFINGIVYITVEHYVKLNYEVYKVQKRIIKEQRPALEIANGNIEKIRKKKKVK